MALDLEAELAAANANLRRIRDERLTGLAVELETETNPYTREFLTEQIERTRKIGAGILED
jgi:hypothetical protein